MRVSILIRALRKKAYSQYEIIKYRAWDADENCEFLAYAIYKKGKCHQRGWQDLRTAIKQVDWLAREDVLSWIRTYKERKLQADTIRVYCGKIQ